MRAGDGQIGDAGKRVGTPGLRIDIVEAGRVMRVSMMAARSAPRSKPAKLHFFPTTGHTTHRMSVCPVDSSHWKGVHRNVSRPRMIRSRTSTSTSRPTITRRPFALTTSMRP